MELNKFVELVAEQFEETSIDKFSPSVNFREFDEWSSLISLSIIAMVDEEFDVQLKGEDIRNSNTIEDLYNIVKSKL